VRKASADHEEDDLIVTGVTNTQPTLAASGASALRDQMKQVMSAVAKKLGMTDADLGTALKSGMSLTDIAKSKGVSADDLKAAITASLTSTNPSLSATQLSTIAGRITGHKGGHHHHHAAAAPAPATDPPSDVSSV
jgi:hypothetical protein